MLSVVSPALISLVKKIHKHTDWKINKMQEPKKKDKCLSKQCIWPGGFIDDIALESLKKVNKEVQTVLVPGNQSSSSADCRRQKSQEQHVRINSNKHFLLEHIDVFCLDMFLPITTELDNYRERDITYSISYI